jgi:7-cyano-7-deazaguanine synthase
MLRDVERSPVRALSIDYGQRHARELRSAERIANLARVEHRVADVRALGSFGGSSQTSDEIAVPHGHYADASMRLTVVPNRNMVLLALATAWAVATKSSAVAYGAHAGDHAVYPDCRAEFADVMAVAMTLCDYEPVALLRPFVQMTKADVVARGAELSVPFAETWSCYEGKQVHCARCGTCVERREAFELAGVPDPTEYAS